VQLNFHLQYHHASMACLALRHLWASSTLWM
jgi:hypothetical protein